ncbi:hypothetical protein ALQ59_200059 [Pseudomonas syringae pv. apii]|nr:hypothetical protein ALQ58_200347 [Pseudomonas syringae pv. apii]RMN52070.1 hypothetical protein ALQ59_200059 [Pseudomonas syringae pv. apii]
MFRDRISDYFERVTAKCSIVLRVEPLSARRHKLGGPSAAVSKIHLDVLGKDVSSRTHLRAKLRIHLRSFILLRLGTLFLLDAKIISSNDRQKRVNIKSDIFSAKVLSLLDRVGFKVSLASFSALAKSLHALKSIRSA